MTARASFRQADLDRALKAAEKAGLKVVLSGSEIHFLPIDANTDLSSANPPFDVQKALATWRQSA